MNIKSKGFTIIELLVVIAIIAVLAAIVLVNVTQYINKSKVSAIEGNLATLQTNGAVYFDQNPTKFGSDFSTDTALGCAGPISTAVTNAAGSLACHGETTTQHWCGTSTTPSYGSTAASTWCVDDSGYRGTLVASKCSATVFSCQ